MTPTLAHIFRHPIKGHGREALAEVVLTAGACLPFDRHWAVAHEAAKLEPGWNSCVNFARGAKAPGLMAITSTLDEPSRTVTLRHPDRGEVQVRPDVAADVPAFLDWVRPLNPASRAQPVGFFAATQGLTDSDWPSVSILSLASLRAFSDRMGHDLSVDRWRGNLWLEGAEPFAEFGWIGREIAVGGTVLQVRERITRCTATTVDPQTGVRDVDTLAGLQQAYGHQDFGVYATVLYGGQIAVGDGWTVR